MSDVTNIFEHKVKKMSDVLLFSECIVALKAMEHGVTTPDHISRMKDLFKEALERPALENSHQDFSTVLRVIKYL